MARPREFDEATALEAAIECFWHRGYEATSVRDLADKMGISGPSLYNAYGDKRALFAQALEYYVDNSARALIKRLEAAQLIKRTRSTEDERQVLIALTLQGHALREKARAVPPSILAASACSIAELYAMKSEIIALRDSAPSRQNRFSVATGIHTCEPPAIASSQSPASRSRTACWTATSDEAHAASTV